MLIATRGFCARQNFYGNTSRVKLEKNFDQILNPYGFTKEFDFLQNNTLYFFSGPAVDPYIKLFQYNGRTSYRLSYANIRKKGSKPLLAENDLKFIFE